MTTHILTGVTFVRDPSQPGDPLSAVAPSTLTLVVPDAVVSMSYQLIQTFPNDLPEVDVTANEIVVSVNSLSDDASTVLGWDPAVYIGQVTWNGNVSQVLVYETGDNSFDASHIFVIGGAPLPPITTIAQAQALEASITAFGLIPGGPLAPGQSIPFASLAGVSTLADNFVTGTNGDDTLTGTAGNDVYNPMSNTSEDVIYGSAGNDIMDFSNYIPGAGAFYSVSYSGLSAGITVNFDSDAAETTVNKGVNGTDNLVDALMAMNWNFGDGMRIAGTAHNDVFNLDLPSDTWIGLTGGEGVDTYNIRTDGIVRISFNEGYGLTAPTAGAEVNLATGAVANDGHGNAEQINVLNANALIEIEGTDFNDTILGSNRDERFILRAGNDTLNAGGGWDELRYDRGGVGAVNVNLATGTATGTWGGNAFSHSIADVEAVRGSRSDGDTLTGSNADNFLDGLGGNDTLFGGGGNDTLRGQAGNDVIDGGAGTDYARMDMNFADATISGTSASVTIVSSQGTDVLTNVEFISFWDQQFDVSSLGPAGTTPTQGPDSLEGSSGNDFIDGLGGDDTIIGFEGNDTITGGDGRDRVFMGAGADIFYDNGQGGVNGSDTVFGNQGNDTIEGGNGNDLFDGGLHNDVIRGRLGDDRLIGGDGFDTLDGGDGNDTVIGGNGRDVAFLGRGNDVYFDNGQGGDLGRDTVFGNQGNDTIEGGNGNDLFDGGLHNDVIRGRLGDDRLIGGDGFDTLDGGDGNDTVIGGNGRDVAFLGRGNDVYFDNGQGGDLGRDAVYGGAGNDTIQGGAGNDTFFGGDGDDLIFARLGDDTLNGGAGNDTMDGGEGSDTFVFAAGFGVDAVNSYLKGVDMLQFDDALWTGTLSAAQVVNQFASVVGGNVVFDFGADEVTLFGVGSLAGLESDLVIV